MDPGEHGAQRPPPAPRAVPPEGGESGIATFLKALVFFGGTLGIVLVAILMTLPPWPDWHLDRRGVRAQAIPISIRERDDEDLTRYVRVEFTDAQGNVHQRVLRTTSEATAARAHARTPIAIEYDPVDPRNARFPGERAGAPLWVCIVLSFAFVAALVLSAFGAVATSRQRRLYRDGTPVTATVTAIEETQSTFHGRPVLRYRYTYLDDGNREHAGSWESASPPAVGASIWVLVDAVDAAHSVPARTSRDAL